MARDSGDLADQWDDSDSGGVSCACGRGCAEGDYAGNPKVGPRAFCETDATHIGSAIRALPEMYVELRLKLAKSQQQEERVSGSREAPTPLDLRVEAFMRHVILVAVSWEEQVRAAADLSQPDGRVRDGIALARACRLLGGDSPSRTGHLSTLLMLEPEDKNRPLPGSVMLRELEPGSSVRIDDAGDAWQKREMGGADAGLEFLALNGHCRSLLGLTLQRRRVPLRCDARDGDGRLCGQLTLVQREALAGGWEPVVRCTACGRAHIGEAFELLMVRWFEATQAVAEASLPAGTQARHGACGHLACLKINRVKR
jgi:hypothetical protein